MRNEGKLQRGREAEAAQDRERVVHGGRQLSSMIWSGLVWQEGSKEMRVWYGTVWYDYEEEEDES